MTKNIYAEAIDDESELVETVGVDERDSEGNIDRAESFAVIGAAVTLILSLIISLAVFVGIVVRKKELKSRFTRWLKEFLNFRKLWVVEILKYVYLFTATFITIGGVVIMFYGGSEPWVMVLVGLGIILIGNLVLRLSFEMTMVMFGLWENTRDMRNVLVGSKGIDGKKLVKKEKEAEKEEKEE